MQPSLNPFQDPALYLAWGICIVFATGQQIAFTYHSRTEGQKKWLWLVGGAVSFLIELGGWMWLLTMVPLSIATPMLGANYITVAMASHFLFKETVDNRRWAGIALIFLGLILIGQ